MEAKNVAVQAAREFLGQARELQAGIANKRHRIEMLRNMATSTTGTMSDMPRSDSPNLQRMETVLCKAADLEMEVARDTARLVEAKQEITAAIGELTEYREQEVLYYRYVECMPWAAIATECGYHRRTIMKRHEDGIAHVAVALEKTGHIKGTSMAL